ncbi:hypothetical protein HEK616_36380 [Streptomyces nigrescens]|uniref:Uncharacterized protein n=1 Tax=Streptomyces nigrescens TaxID=1920 RepID=A0ABN6QZS9_STRNI|nr:hypothetical protein HEK616_36380 [Streptomyces nigrescens]
MRHRELFTKLGQPRVEEFFAPPHVRPLPGFGLCSVEACHRHRANSSNLCCSPHWVRWKEAQARRRLRAVVPAPSSPGHRPARAAQRVEQFDDLQVRRNTQDENLAAARGRPRVDRSAEPLSASSP